MEYGYLICLCYIKMILSCAQIGVFLYQVSKKFVFYYSMQQCYLFEVYQIRRVSRHVCVVLKGYHFCLYSLWFFELYSETVHVLFFVSPYWNIFFFFFFGYGKPSTYWCLLSGACLVKCFQIYKIFQNIDNLFDIIVILFFSFILSVFTIFLLI